MAQVPEGKAGPAPTYSAQNRYTGIRQSPTGISNKPASILRQTWSGDRRDTDPSQEVRGMPPNFGEGALPHVITFQGIVSSVARVYRPSDEAIKDSYDNARFMRNSPDVMECVENRQRSTALLDWHLEPDDATNPTHVQLCEDLTAIVEQIPRFMQMRENLLHALWYGRYATQFRYRWKKIRGQMRLVIDRWLPVNGDKLVFRYDDGTMEHNPDQIGVRVGAGFTTGNSVAKQWHVERINKVEPTDYGLAYFFETWERSLLAIHRHMIEDGEYEDPRSAGKIHGVGIRSRIYWAWYQKQETLAFMMEFLERSATGIEIWYYPWGNPEAEKATRKAAEERIGQGRNIILVPRPLGDEAMNYGVERIEPSMAGVDALQHVVTDYFGHMIKRYILGQTLTTEAESTGLGSNLASVHLDTFLQIVKYDATNLEETLTTDLIEPLKRYNFPKYADIPVAFRIDTESPDVEGKLKAWREAYDMGVKFKSQDVMDLIGATKPDDTDETLQSPEHQQAQMQIAAQKQQQAAMEQQAAAAQQTQVAMPSNPEADELWKALETQKVYDHLAQRGMTDDQFAADGVPRSENAEREKLGTYAAERYSMAEAVAQAASETDQNPSEKAKQAGNYRKGRVRIQGMEIAIENPKGSVRSGKTSGGTEWSVTMTSHYGYIKQTESEADGDHVDVFLGPHLDSEVVFVIDQTKYPGWQVFDEHKVMMGWKSKEKAKQAYLDSYSPGWRGFESITTVTLDQFKAWLKHGDSGKRISEQVTDKYAKKEQLDDKYIVERGDNYASCYAKGWEEGKHPRADDGKFGEGGGGTATAEPPKPKVTKLPKDLSNLTGPQNDSLVEGLRKLSTQQLRKLQDAADNQGAFDETERRSLGHIRSLLDAAVGAKSFRDPSLGEAASTETINSLLERTGSRIRLKDKSAPVPQEALKPEPESLDKRLTQAKEDTAGLHKQLTESGDTDVAKDVAKIMASLKKSGKRWEQHRKKEEAVVKLEEQQQSAHSKVDQLTQELAARKEKIAALKAELESSKKKKFQREGLVEQFARAFGERGWPERYGKQMTLFDESDHPRDDGGKFAEKEGGGEALPERTADTMSDVIAQSSPSGRTSKRAKQAAQKKLSEDLFGPGGLAKPKGPEQSSEKEYLLKKAKELREWAERGLRPRANLKEAKRLEAQAAELDKQFAKTEGGGGEAKPSAPKSTSRVDRWRNLGILATTKQAVQDKVQDLKGLRGFNWAKSAAQSDEKIEALEKELAEKDFSGTDPRVAELIREIKEYKTFADAARIKSKQKPRYTQDKKPPSWSDFAEEYGVDPDDETSNRAHGARLEFERLRKFPLESPPQGSGK